MIDISVLWEITEKEYIDNIIKKVVNKALEEEKVTGDAEVSIVITDNENIQKMNNKYRKIDAPTDVLSFPGYEKEEYETLKNAKGNLILGDIVISFEKVEEQAKLYENTLEREFSYLLLHGMLHLMGYDHIEEEDKKKMRKREEEILSVIGDLNI